MNLTESLHPNSSDLRPSDAAPSASGQNNGSELLCRPFFKRYGSLFPQLSVDERKLSGFIRFLFSSHEIAQLMGSEMREIEERKRNLRRRLGLTQQENLVDFIREF